MHLRQHFLIAAAVTAAVGVTAGAAVAGGKHHHAGRRYRDNEPVKAKIHKGTLEVTGTNRADSLELRLQAGDPNTLEVVAGAGSRTLRFDRTLFDSISVDARRGDDTVTIDETNGAFTDTESTTLAGGDGNDRLIGGSFNERFVGGDGNDFVDGNRGADTAFLGAGDDTFQWDPGDGSDVVEGEAGADTMLFNGANIAERFELSANGPRLRFTRDVGGITMDTAGVETVDVEALGGADTITVGDLTGTDVRHVETNLAATGGGGDGAADRVVVKGTNGADAVRASGRTGSATVTGLTATVAITGAEAAADVLEIDALAGDDVVDATALAADAIRLVVDGGNDNDVLEGGAGDDVLSGGPGDDILNGGPGQDTLDGGPGNNVLIQ